MKIFLILVGFAFLTGCSSTRISDTRFDNEVSWNQYKTFNFFDRLILTDTLTEAETTRLNQIKSSVTAEMQNAGYTLSNVAPHLLISMGVIVTHNAQPQPVQPRYIGQRNYTWKQEEMAPGRFATGTAIIEIVDAATKSLIWSGTVEGMLPKQEAKVESAVKEGVARLFKQHPLPKHLPAMGL